MRPELNINIDIDTFNNYYWLKEELQSFCRQNGLSPSGSKGDITNRIHTFLKTGEIQKPERKKSTTKKKRATEKELSLDTVITADHRCSQDVRAFFKTVIPNFHFSTYIQDYFKSNVGKTYRDAVVAWNEEEKRKKILRIKRRLLLSSSIIGSFEIFFRIPVTRVEAGKRPSLLGMISKNVPEATNTSARIYHKAMIWIGFG